jgi:hypothetical protein
MSHTLGESEDQAPEMLEDRTFLALYWAIAAAMLAIGYFSLSEGLPLITIGLALVALAPVVGRKGLFWPALAGVLAFNFAYLGVAPRSCTTYSGSEPEMFGRVVCRNLLGLDYSGSGDYAPSLVPALTVALVTGLIAWGIVRLTLQERPSDTRSDGFTIRRDE